MDLVMTPFVPAAFDLTTSFCTTSLIWDLGHCSTVISSVLWGSFAPYYQGTQYSASYCLVLHRKATRHKLLSK